MKCYICGAEMKQDEMFCPYCGTKRAETGESFSSEQYERTESSWRAPEKIFPQKENVGLSSGSKKMFLGIGVIVAALVVIIVLISQIVKPTINLNNYLEDNVTISGYDGYGSVNAYFDSEKVVYDYIDKVKIPKKTYYLYGYDGFEGYKADMMWEALEAVVDGSFDKSEGLSNGETVTYVWSISNADKKEFEESFHCRLKYKDYKVSIDGLEKVEAIDPFQKNEFRIVCEGMSPHGTVSVNNIAHSDIIYSVEPQSDLANGDIITVTAQIAGDADTAGFVLSPSSKEFEVSGLDSYVTKLEDISDELMKQMEKQARDYKESRVAKTWDDPSQFSMERIGAYLAVGKQNLDHNEVYLIFKITKNGEDPFSYYYYVSFVDLILHSDGSCTTDLMVFGYPDDSFFSNEYFVRGDQQFSGYETLESLYNSIIAPLKSYYTIDEDITE